LVTIWVSSSTGKNFMDKIAILGLGKTAFSLIRHALDDELYDITVIEKKGQDDFQESMPQINFLTQEGVKFHFNTQEISLLDDIDIVAISPGFQPDTEIIQYICKLVEEDRIKYLTDLDLFITKLQDLETTVNAVRYVAITGTNGKTTTSELTAHLLGTKAVGNNGTPFLDFWSYSKANIAVLEVSSFQLFYSKQSILEKFPAQAAIYLNLTEDHLDWHRNMDEYKTSKKKLFNLSSYYENSLIFNYDDPYLLELAHGLNTEKSILNEVSREEPKNENDESPSREILSKIKLFSSTVNLSEKPELNEFDIAFLHDDFFNLRINGKIKKICSVNSVQLKGNHNYSNILSSLLACSDFTDVSNAEFASKLKSFKPVEHRLEFVAKINGKDFYNDSKATNPESAIKSLTAFNKCLAIVGGKDKGLDLQEFIKILIERAEAIFIIGELSDKIADALKAHNYQNFIKVKNLEKAIDAALASPQKIPVILCPASSSFDMFKNFEERGNVFKNLVLQKMNYHC
jgi:UDP-N-acetylmuramoylalanine--D-glutamate ligase